MNLLAGWPHLCRPLRVLQSEASGPLPSRALSSALLRPPHSLGGRRSQARPGLNVRGLHKGVSTKGRGPLGPPGQPLRDSWLGLGGEGRAGKGSRMERRVWPRTEAVDGWQGVWGGGVAWTAVSPRAVWNGLQGGLGRAYLSGSDEGLVSQALTGSTWWVTPTSVGL